MAPATRRTTVKAAASIVPPANARRQRIELAAKATRASRVSRATRAGGAGEVLGTKQSGLPAFRVADLAVHGELLAAARDDARLILERDPDLKSDRGEALRVLLYLFERDAAVRLLRSG